MTRGRQALGGAPMNELVHRCGCEIREPARCKIAARIEIPQDRKRRSSRSAIPIPGGIRTAESPPAAGGYWARNRESTIVGRGHEAVDPGGVRPYI